ncbi:MAG: hypothetical protein PHO63_01765 [Bacilli bacterium]|nr:hypothetical protein [Bacilli bacterium]MDD4809112.1 hypothetical protein [Bacilli bacterium]
MKFENKIIVMLLAALILLLLIKPINDKIIEPNKKMSIDNLKQLFPSQKIVQTFKQGKDEYKVKVNNIVNSGDYTLIETEYDIEEADGIKTIYTSYTIEDEKVIKSDKHVKNGNIIDYTSQTEVIVGIPYKNKTWIDSSDQTIYKVTDVTENQVTIESIKPIDVLDDDKQETIQKKYKEKMIFEKGKGMVLFRSEVTDYPGSIYEIKLVK